MGKTAWTLYWCLLPVILILQAYLPVRRYYSAFFSTFLKYAGYAALLMSYCVYLDWHPHIGGPGHLGYGFMGLMAYAIALLIIWLCLLLHRHCESQKK